VQLINQRSKSAEMNGNRVDGICEDFASVVEIECLIKATIKSRACMQTSLPSSAQPCMHARKSGLRFLSSLLRSLSCFFRIEARLPIGDFPSQADLGRTSKRSVRFNVMQR
jgi:hypothetical protein